jgi:hypothetical protein
MSASRRRRPYASPFGPRLRVFRQTVRMNTVLAAVGMVLFVACIEVAAWVRFGDAPAYLLTATLRPRG